MKTLKSITTPLLALIVGIGSTLSAQKTDSGSIKLPVFGFGFKVAQISVSDLLENTMPGNKFLVTITPHKNFRLEGSLGFLSQKRENERGTELPSKSVFYGITSCGLWQKGNTNFYGGIRLGLLQYSQDSELQGVNSTGEIYYYMEETKGKTNSLGGVIGVEYFFSRHFTIGGEISISTNKNTHENPVPAGTPAGYLTETISRTTITETGLVTRFYF